MHQLMKQSGIPLKISIFSVLIFILGSIYLVYYSTKNYNRRLDEQIDSNAKSIAFVLEAQYLEQGKQIEEKALPNLQKLLDSEKYLRKVAIISMPESTYVYSTNKGEINRRVTDDLLKILQKGTSDSFGKGLISYQNDQGEIISAIQFAGKIISPDASVNPIGYVQILYDWEQISAIKQKFFNVILFSIVAVILICFFVLFFLLSRISMYVQKINSVLQNFVEGSFRMFPEKRNDELGETRNSLKKLGAYLEVLHKDFAELKKSSDARNSQETVEKSEEVQLENQSVIAKISVDALHQLFSPKYSDELMDVMVQIYEYLDAHFLNYNGKIFEFNGTQATVVFSKGQTEKTAVEALHELRRKIRIFSPSVPKIQRKELNLKAALHKGNILHSRINAFGNGYPVFMGNAYRDLEKLFRLAGKEEILISSSVAKEVKISFNLLTHSRYLTIENEPDAEIFMLPSDLSKPEKKSAGKVLSRGLFAEKKTPEQAPEPIKKIRDTKQNNKLEEKEANLKKEHKEEADSEETESIFSMVEETFQTKTYK